MKRRRLKKKVIYYFFGIVIVIFALVFFIKHQKLINSSEYKLEQLGYNSEEITIILEKGYTDFALEKYYSNLTSFITSKYYIKSNLENYLNYYEENKTVDISKIISIINVGTNKDFYTDVKTTSNDDYLILVNKYNSLSSTYEPSDLVNMSLLYAYNDNKIRSEVNTKYNEMAAVAKAAGLKLITIYSYRSYAKQEETYNKYYDLKGLSYAEENVARAGFSEHQTGLALDITTSLEENEEFIDTDEYSWLIDNSYKYGFILRYPESKEDITGYSFEPWHYRYVGIDVATIIHNEGITFDEYYAYYIENNEN